MSQETNVGGVGTIDREGAEVAVSIAVRFFENPSFQAKVPASIHESTAVALGNRRRAVYCCVEVIMHEVDGRGIAAMRGIDN